MPDRAPVASSSIVSAGYDEASETLEVEYQNGHVYQYYNVPLSVYEMFSQAPSKGQFVNMYIKPQYPYSRVG